MKFRYYLLVMSLLLTLGPLLLFRAWPHSEVLQGELDEVHERHLLLANNLAAALERYHRDLVTTFELLLEAPNAWKNTGSTSVVLNNLHFRHVCIADWETGRVVDTLALAATPCPKALPSNTLQHLQGLVQRDTVAFGPVVEAPDGQNVMHLVKRSGEFLAVGAITTAYFRELGEAISFGVLGHAALVDNTGRALSHPLADWTATRKDMSKISAVQRMLNRETGVETFYSPALKGDMIAGFTFVHPVGWGVMIPQPIAELHQRAEDARESTLIVLMIGIVSALSVAFFASMRVVRPLEQISDASCMIARGDLDVPEPQVQRLFLPIELKELQLRFYDMVQRMRENITTIHKLAYMDSVTGLENRTFLQANLDCAFNSCAAGTMFLIDLDGFKSVNDTHGHDVGDKVLQVIGKRLCALLDPSGDPRKGLGIQRDPEDPQNFVARLGGDEFAVWVLTDDEAEVAAFAKKIVQDIRKTINIAGNEIQVGASVGVAIAPQDGADRITLLKSADLAMYEAKNAGKNGFVRFAPALQAAVIAQRTLGHEIERGIRNGAFVAHFQPQFSLPDRAVRGVEALARWQHPDRGLLLPAEFLETAQDIGVLHEIDRIILHTAVQQMRDLTRSGHQIHSLAVNLSEDRLMSHDFLKALDLLVDLPFELRFELVETTTLDRIDGRMAWNLDRVREAGFKLDLDDFGSANASVLGLMNVEPSHLKIDRKLVFGMEPDNVSERLVRSIIQMGHSLDIPIIAEGAEHEDHLTLLEKLGCDFVQGFILARPMEMQQLARFLQVHRPDALMA